MIISKEMFPLFHVFIPVLVYELFLYCYPSTGFKVNRIWIIIGSMLPDILDKPLSLIFGSNFSGRGIFHAPFLWITLAMVLFFISKQRTIVSGIFYGVIFHLILDLPEVPLLWPFLPLTIYQSDISDWITTLFENRLVQITEIIGFFGLILIVYFQKIIFHPKILDWDAFQDFLFKNPKPISFSQKKNKINKRATNINVSISEMGNDSK